MGKEGVLEAGAGDGGCWLGEICDMLQEVI